MDEQQNAGVNGNENESHVVHGEIQLPAEEQIGEEMRSYIRGSINANTRQATINVRKF